LQRRLVTTVSSIGYILVFSREKDDSLSFALFSTEFA